MNDPHDHQPLRTLFSEQAALERKQMPSFDDTLRTVHVRPRLSMARLALAASLLLVAGVGLPLVYRNVHQVTTPQPSPVALPNMLEALDSDPLLQWQSPTACLLDITSLQVPESTPTPELKPNGPESRSSKG